MELNRLPWYSRVWGTVTGWVRTALGSIKTLRSPPGRAGISSGRVASPKRAEQDLSNIASSPTIYAAVLRRALTFATYPVRVYSGYSIGGRKLKALDPEKVPWVGSLLRLLQLPEPEDSDSDAVFPANPGEGLLAQIVADLIMTGNAFVAITMSKSGDIIGLHRLHPRCMTLERGVIGDEWVYRANMMLPKRYPRRTVAHLKLLSWESGAQGELGTGAGAPLQALVRAEKAALNQTANMVEQGGGDVIITAAGPTGAAFLSNKENRDKVAKEMTEALIGEDGRRTFVVGGDFKVGDSGIKPADLRAPELIKESRSSELSAIGAVPVGIGADAGTYATAVQQYRTQAELDEQIQSVLEAGFLRPLARHFARRAGGRWLARLDQVTARIDLSSHPGYAYMRTEQVSRMTALVTMGWDAEQASEAEGLDLPKPTGQPRQMAGGPPNNGPAAPLGDGAGPRTTPLAPPALGSLFRDAEFEEIVPPTPMPPEAERIAHHHRVEARRATADKDLQTASQAALDEDLKRYLAAVLPALEASDRMVRAEQPDPEKIVPAAEPNIYTQNMGTSWLNSWESGASNALDGVEGAEDVPTPENSPGTLDPLHESAKGMAATTREGVIRIVRRGLDEGLSTQDIAANIRSAYEFSPERSLLMARTETVISQQYGTNARYSEAENAGLDIEVEWMAGTPTPSQRPDHRALDGAVQPVGGKWTFADGVKTDGPGLSGVAEHDCNCRCGTRARLRKK